jgi:hypothetical protein
MALINNLGIVYNQYCSSSYLDYIRADPGPHTSATCGTKAAGHMDVATASNTMGGSDANKGWNTRRT